MQTQGFESSTTPFYIATDSGLDVTGVEEEVRDVTPTTGDSYNLGFSNKAYWIAFSLNNEYFGDNLLERFEKYHIPKEKFCFEIAKSSVVSNLIKISRFLS